MNKEKVIDFIVYLTIIILIFSLTLLCITIYSVEFDLNDHTLIAGIIAFVGAILGGIISGLLTLKGVRLTIKDNKEKELNDALPNKLLDIESIIFVLERQYKLLIENYEKNKDNVSSLNPYYRQRINFIIQCLEDDGLLKKSANVNINTYRIIRLLYNKLKNYIYTNKGVGIHPYEKINAFIESTISNLKVECEKLTKQIDTKN